MDVVDSLRAVFWPDTECDILMFFADNPSQQPPKLFCTDDECYPTQKEFEELRLEGYQHMLI